MRYCWLALLLLASCVSSVPPNRSIVRLAKKPGEPFASLVRSAEATAYRDRSVVVSARLKSIGIPKGPNGVWLRADGADRKLLGFSNSYQRSVIGESDWVERVAVLDIDAKADRIVFGVMNSSTDALLVDDLRIEPVESFRVDPLSTRASEYLDDALERIRRLAYYSSRVDWPRARSTARIMASAAQTTTDTYDAIRYVLALLGDHHSFLFAPDYVQEARTSTAREFQVKGAILGEIGYVAVPGYNGQNAERSKAFSSEIRKYLDEAQAVHACRWIVDLRNDTGGNMYPMLAGLHPLLGDQPLGYFHSRGGEWIPWTTRISGWKGRDASHDAVAVITGPKTTSAGEAVTLSFRGRAHTRSFGEPTSGHSTANQSVALSDGALIALTTGLMADRDRNLASGSIRPDEIVDVAEIVHLDEDAAIRAAAAWLRSQACAEAPG